MDDVKARLAEILGYHIGKTGIIFDQKDAFAHDYPSIAIHQPRCQRAHQCLRDDIRSATFLRCSGLSTSATSASASAMRLLSVYSKPICSARRRSIALRSMVGAVKSVMA